MRVGFELDVGDKWRGLRDGCYLCTTVVCVVCICVNVRARARVKDVQANGMVLAAVDKLRDASVAFFSSLSAL